MIRGTVNNAVGTVLPAVAGLWAVPRIIEAIGLAQFGVFSLQVGALFLLGLSDFGISRAIVLLAPDPRFAPKGRRSAYGVGLRLSALLAAAICCLALPVGAGVALILQSRPDVADLAWSSALLCVSAGVMLLTLAPRAALESQERFFLSNLIRGPAAAAIFLAPLAAFTVRPSLTAAAVAILATRVLAAGLFFLAAPPPRRGAEDVATGRRELERFFFAKAGWIGGATALTLVITYADRFVLGLLGSAAGLAQFVIAHEVVTKLWIVMGAALAAAAPRLAAQAGREADSARSTKQLTAIVFVAGALPALVLLVWGEAILRLWLGANFQPGSVLPLQLMAAGVGLNSLSQVNFLLLQVRGGERESMLLQACSLAFLVIVLPWLVLRMGPVGAALTFALRLLVDTFLLRHLLDRTWSGTGRAVGVRLPMLAGTAVFFAVAAAASSMGSGVGSVPAIRDNPLSDSAAP